MRDYQSLAHVRWECKYHIVWVPKYRRKRLYGKVRRRFGEIIRDLCNGVVSGLDMGQIPHDLLNTPPDFPVLFQLR